VVSAPVPSFQVHRSGFGLALGVLFVVVGALMVVDGVTHTASGHAGVVALLGVALIAMSVVFGLRPSVAETPAGVVVNNPLRTTSVPWTRLTDADVSDVLRIHAAEQVVRCYAIPRKGRPGARSMVPGSAPGSRPRSPDFIASRLTELAERERVGQYDVSEVRTLWSPVAVGAVALATVACSIALGGALL